mgnify:CR=1 FL=1
MALTKEVSEDYEIKTEFKMVQIRTKTAIVEDDVEISSSYHRHVIAPGDDYSNESADVKKLCSTFHTKAVKDAYKASLETTE